MKYTVRIEIDTEQTGEGMSEILNAARDLFADAIESGAWIIAYGLFFGLVFNGLVR